MLFTYLVCYDEHLPQGAVSSSMISNLILKDFDKEVGVFENSEIFLIQGILMI